MLTCPNCQAKNTNGAEACVSCGTRLSARDFGVGVTTTSRERPGSGTREVQEEPVRDAPPERHVSDSCPSCGKPVALGATFCGACGKSLTEDEGAESTQESKRGWMTGVVKVSVRPRPDLTTETLVERLQEHYSNRYDVYKTPSWRGREVMIRRSATVGVAVQAKHSQKETQFLVGGTMPSDPLNFLMRASMGLGIVTFGLWALVLRVFLPTEDWKMMESEVSEFLRKDIGL